MLILNAAPLYRQATGSFTITVEGHEIQIDFDLEKMWTMAYFEFRGPVSPTGYHAHFEPYDGKFPPTWEEWIVMATEYAMRLFKRDGRAYLRQQQAGQQIALLPI